MKNAKVAFSPGWIKLIWQAVNRDLTKRGLNRRLATAFILFKDQGLSGLKQRLLEKATQMMPKPNYQTWVELYSTLTNQDRASIKKHIMTFKCQPKEGDLCENIQHHWLHYTLIINVSSSKVRYGLVGIPFELVTLEVIHE